MKILTTKLVTVAGLLVFAAMSGAADVVRLVLLTVWPLAAAALAIILLAGAVALAIWFIGDAIQRVRPGPWAELLSPGAPAATQHSYDVGGGPVIEDDGRLDNSIGWRQETIKFAIIGNSLGFSQRAMAGHVSRASWETYKGLLVDAGALVSDKSGTTWADGWGIGRLGAELRHEVLSLPCPNGRAPVVRWIGPDSHTQRTQHTQVITGAHN